MAREMVGEKFGAWCLNIIAGIVDSWHGGKVPAGLTRKRCGGGGGLSNGSLSMGGMMAGVGILVQSCIVLYEYD